MLSNIIKVKLEKNSCSFKELEKFFAKRVLHIKGFKEPSVKLVMKHHYFDNKILTLTLPREVIPNSFALKLLSSLFVENMLALPIILKYLAHRNLSKDFDEISKKLQDEIDQDIKEAKLQNNSETSKKIELCKQDILNVLNGGKSRLDGPLTKKYYSILENEIEELKAKISGELEDYVNNDNTNIHEIYKSINNKRKKIECCEKIQDFALFTSVSIVFMPFFVPIIALIVEIISYIGLLKAHMYSAAPFLIVAALALTIAGVAYLTGCYLEHSFAKEMQDYIKEPRHMDKATNTEDVKKLEQEETEVGDLIDLSGNCEMNCKVEPGTTIR